MIAGIFLVNKKQDYHLSVRKSEEIGEDRGERRMCEEDI